MRKKGLELNILTIGLAGAMILLSASASPGQGSFSQQNLSVKEKSPDTAFWWSFVGTTVPMAALAAGIAGAEDLGSIGLVGVLVGPSLGYFYGGLPWRGLLGMGIRSIGLGVMFVAFLGAWNEAWSWGNSGENGEDWGAVAWAGLGIMAGSAIWDVLAVKGAVHRRNLRTRDRALALAPLLNPRTKTVGLTLKLSF